jgi:hypothetical protein
MQLILSLREIFGAFAFNRIGVLLEYQQGEKNEQPTSFRHSSH